MSFLDLKVDAVAANVIYQPSGDGPMDQGWNYTNTKASLNQFARRTVQKGATVQLSWFGTGVRLIGHASDGTYRTTLDEEEPMDGQPAYNSTAEGTQLVKYSDLENKNHTVTLEVIGDGENQVSFMGAFVTLQLSGQEKWVSFVSVMSSLLMVKS